MTEQEQRVFINWQPSDIGYAENVVVVQTVADAQAIWNVVPMPIICLAWNSVSIEWLRSYVKQGWLRSVKQFFLAEGSGKATEVQMDQMASFLGSAKCYVCRWPEDCSCAAETQERYDDAKIVECMAAAFDHPYTPIGVVTVESLKPKLTEMWKNKTVDTGLSVHWGKDFDTHCRFNMGSVGIIVGREGEGKSTWVDELTMRLALYHDLKISIWTPEAKYMESHTEKLLRLLYQRDEIGNLPIETFTQGLDFIDNHFTYIDFPYPEGYEEMTQEEKLRYQPTLSQLVKRASHNAERYGSRVFVFDPVLLIQKENARQKDFDFYRDVIDKAKYLAMKYEALVLLVTHPHRANATDLQRSDRPITKDDIFGSSLFAYLLDYVFAINRFDSNDVLKEPYVSLQIGKVKQQRYGTRGMCYFTFQPRGERFIPTEMKSVKPNGDDKGPSHMEPAYTKINPKRWLNEKGKPDLEAVEYARGLNPTKAELESVSAEGMTEIEAAPQGEASSSQLSLDSLNAEAMSEVKPQMPD